MSKLKISDNLFLEKAELVRLQEFFGPSGWQRALKSFVKSYGVVQNDATSFAVVSSAEANSVDILPGLAYNSEMEAIVSEERVTIPLGTAVANQDKWIILSRAVTNAERGRVSIQSDGSLVGIGTEFTKVLRGQPNFPTKVRFVDSDQNVLEYEVVSVISDTNAVLSGGFVPESGMRYSVVGAFTPGFIPSAGDREIYEHDFFAISVVNSVDRPQVSANEFIIAQIKYNVGGTHDIVDLRGSCRFSVQSASSGSSEQASEGRNPMISLTGIQRVGGTAWGEKFARLELFVEFAYKINSFDYASNGGNYSLTISSGSCNALAVDPASLPNGLFNGFVVLNRDNMRSVKILAQTANVLSIENDENASMLLSDNSDLIIIPDFSQLEVAAIVDGNVDEASIPFTKQVGTADGRMRMCIDVKYPQSGDSSLQDSIGIQLKYRLFSGDGQRGYPFAFNTATYHDYIRDIDAIAGNGHIDVELASIVPVEPERNYS